MGMLVLRSVILALCKAVDCEERLEVAALRDVRAYDVH
jgi:hypothetical protein